MIFRKPCTWLIILFSVFNLCYIKKGKFTKNLIIPVLIIASPFLLELFLFWNNDSFKMGFKSLEKSVSLLIFPLFILGNHQRIDYIRIIKNYSIITTCTVFLLLFRFALLYPELMHKYLNGIDLWETGYRFARSFGMHAPALNMHLAFVSVINLYLVFYSFQKKKTIFSKISYVLVFVVSFFLILVVNTRMALFDALVGFGFVFYYEIVKKYNYRKVLGTLAILMILVMSVFVLYIQKNPYMKTKYYTVTFAHMDKVGKLDEIKNPEVEVFNSLVTRISIWKSALTLSLNNLPFGAGAADGKPELFKYYRQTHQKFLSKYDFPVHNQYIDSFLKFGILGVMVVMLYVLNLFYLGYTSKNAIIIAFFFIFFTSNITDDYLIRFDGIAFSGFWGSVFTAYYLLKNRTIIDRS